MSHSSSTLYFAYGSNLWLAQMARRCPSSPYTGLARLHGYYWLINSRGYANVAKLPNTLETPDTSHVWALTYALTPADEAALDINEGVPHAYEKAYVSADYWPAGWADEPVDITLPTVQCEVLVYIDRKRTVPDVPRKEYVYRMNRGVADALACGVPETYVERVIRGFIPAEDGKEVGEEVLTLAGRQAGNFRDAREAEARIEVKSTGSGE
ncbi:hypothetical protein EJ06DRAFT_517439 [Trichodelitschia bisporula]|uniref:gamma-glutamylcyclotransferase n=1 Tax=Trichodelitschia bisporula TaxID=703511 RepID=A0A6G1HI85_9PEZI|nr:hypothetical protein EJ06DRAFT_517439 [Trichodelitschia bisporula]